jgi:lipopolysaccharide biosynthesis glycosyltransferase
MGRVLDFKIHKKIKYLEKDIKNKREIALALKTSIKSLTTYDNYSSINRIVYDLHVLYSDIKREQHKSLETLERLKNEQEAMVEE